MKEVDNKFIFARHDAISFMKELGIRISIPSRPENNNFSQYQPPVLLLTHQVDFKKHSAIAFIINVLISKNKMAENECIAAICQGRISEILPKEINNKSAYLSGFINDEKEHILSILGSLRFNELIETGEDAVFNEYAKQIMAKSGFSSYVNNLFLL